MNIRDLYVQRGDINGDKWDIQGKVHRIMKKWFESLL
jgi:hypothetical protein